MAKTASKPAKKTPAKKPKPVSPALKAARKAAKAKGKAAAARPPKAAKPNKAQAAAPLAPTLMDEGKAHAVRPVSGFEAAAGALSNVIRVPFKRLRENPANYRKTYDEAAIAELADSILAEGLLQNLVTFPADAKGYYVINSGNRRFRALQLLFKRKKIDEEYLVHIYPKNMTDAEALALAIVENLQRQDVDPMEEADGFKRLRDLDWSTEQIAKAVGLKQRTVQDRLQLSEGLFSDARKALSEKKITLDQARAIVTAPTAKLQNKLLGYATRTYQPYNAEQLRQALRASLPKISDAAFDIALYKGDFVGEGKNRMFADPDQFTELQKAHAKALLADLKKKWKKATIVSFFYAGHYVKEEDPTKGEAFMVINEHQFHRIAVYEGYADKSGHEPDADEIEFDDDTLETVDPDADKTRAQQREELKEFGQALASAVLARPVAMVRAAIAGMFSERACPLIPYVEVEPSSTVLEGFDYVFDEPLRAQLVACDMLNDRETHALWSRLCKMSDQDVLRLFAALLLPANLERHTHWRPSPFDRTVVDALGVALPSFLTPAAADPMTCRSCGCTQDNACVTEDGPCAWAEPGLCTACAEKEAGEGDDHFGGSEEAADEPAETGDEEAA